MPWNTQIYKMFAEQEAKRLQRTSVPHVGDVEIVRYFPMGRDVVIEEAQRFADTFVSMKNFDKALGDDNPAAYSVTDPIVDGKTYPGTYRAAFNRGSREKEEPGIVQTLRLGYVTDELPSTYYTRQVHDRDRTPFDLVSVEENDEILEYRNIARESIDDLKPAIGATLDSRTVIDVQSELYDDKGAGSIFVLVRSLDIPNQTVTTGGGDEASIAFPSKFAERQSLIYYDIDVQGYETEKAKLETPPSGYAVLDVRAERPRDGVVNLVQDLKTVYDYAIDGDNVERMSIQNAGVETERVDYRLHAVKEADLQTALEALDGTPVLAGYHVLGVSHNHSGQGFADVTQHLSAKQQTADVVVTDAASINGIMIADQFPGQVSNTLTYLWRNVDPDDIPDVLIAIRAFTDSDYILTDVVDSPAESDLRDVRMTIHRKYAFNTDNAELVSQENYNIETERLTYRLLHVRDTDFTTAFTSLNATPIAEGYHIIGVSHNYSGRGFSDITQHLHAKQDEDDVTVTNFAAIDGVLTSEVFPGTDDEERTYLWKSIDPAAIDAVIAELEAFTDTEYVLTRITSSYLDIGLYNVQMQIAKANDAGDITSGDIDDIDGLLTDQRYPTEPDESRTYRWYSIKGDAVTLAAAKAKLLAFLDDEWDIVEVSDQKRSNGLHTLGLVIQRVYADGAAADTGSAKFTTRRMNPDENAEEIERTYPNIHDPVATDTEFTAATSGYHVLSIDIQGPEKGFGTVVVRERKIGIANFQTETRFEGADAEKRTLILPDRDADAAPSDPVAAGYLLVSKSNNEKGQGLADYTFDYAKIGISNFQIITRFGSAAAEERTIILPDRVAAPSAPVVSGYVNVSSSNNEKGQGLADYTFNYIKVGTANYQTQTEYEGEDGEQKVIVLPRRTSVPSDPVAAGYKLVSKSHTDLGQSLANYVFNFVKVGTQDYTTETAHESADAEERTIVLPRRTSEPSDPVVAGYLLVSKSNNETGKGFADYAYRFVKEGVSTTIKPVIRIPGNTVYEDISITIYNQDAEPSDPNPDATSYHLVRKSAPNQHQDISNWTFEYTRYTDGTTPDWQLVGIDAPDGDLVQTYITRKHEYADAGTILDAVKSENPSGSANLSVRLIDHRNGLASVMKTVRSLAAGNYTLSRKAVRKARKVVYNTSGGILTRKDFYSVNRTITETISVSTYDTVTAANSYVSSLSLGPDDSATVKRLRDGSAVVIKVDTSSVDSNTILLYKVEYD